MIERRRPLDTRSERSEIPKVAQSLQDRGSRVCDALSGAVSTELLDLAGINPGGDKPGWDTATKTVELEGVARAVRCGCGVGEVIGARCKWWRDVVGEASCLVEGDDEQGVLPLGAVTERIVDLFQEHFAVGDKTSWVH